ncbi:MAG: GtrA family protein [Sphingomonadaceae bacterium]
MMTDDHREIAGQVIRFGLTGGLLTLLVAGSYWAIAELLHIDPMLSLTLVFIVFTALGYVLHSRWSFAGHGARDNVGVRGLRFFASNSLGFLANQGFVWFLVKYLGGPTWWPIIPIIFVTPLITFTLNRRWVFG